MGRAARRVGHIDLAKLPGHTFGSSGSYTCLAPTRSAVVLCRLGREDFRLGADDRGFGSIHLGTCSLGFASRLAFHPDALVRHSLYAYVRHPIYAGGLLIFVGGVLLKPTATVGAACALGFIWLIVQARLEEIDLVERLPQYREYMKEVPRFVPRRRSGKADVKRQNRGLMTRHA